MKKLAAALPGYLLPRLGDILFIALLAAVVLLGPRLFNQDGDLGRHITIGNYILDTGSIPARDVFSHTMTGEPLVPHEWLSQVLLALAHRWMGLSGDVFLTALVIALTFRLVYQEMLKRGVARLTAVLVTLLAAAAASIHWLARPHIFTLLLCTVWTCQLERTVREESRSLWQFPLMMLLWVNLHGAFIAGFVIWGALLAGWWVEFRQGLAPKNVGKQLGWIGGLSLAVTFINPAGARLWATSLGYLGNDYLVSHTAEYFSPDFHLKPLWPFLFLLGFAIFALSRGHRLRLHESFLLAGWAVMGLYSMRNIPLFAVVSAPILGGLLQSTAGGMPWLARLEQSLARTEAKLRGWLWSAAAALCLGLLLWRGVPLDMNGGGNRYDPAIFPVEAVDWLEQNPQPGAVFNDFTWGGYLLYRLWPAQTVFIDGQTDFYGEALTREYAAVIGLQPGWEQVLDRYAVDWAILPADGRLAGALEAAGWQVLHADGTALILRRSAAP